LIVDTETQRYVSSNTKDVLRVCMSQMSYVQL